VRFLTILIALFSLTVPAFGEDQKPEKPVDKSALLKQARAHLAKEEFDKAIEVYDSLIKLDVKGGDRAKLYDMRGFARLKQKEYDKAVADFTVAIEHEPKNARFVFNRGMAYHDGGQFEKALADYQQSLDLNGNSAATYAERGLLYNLMGEFEKAQDDFLAGYKIDPKSFYNVYGLAMLRSASPNEKLRNGKEALDYAEQLMKLEKKGLNANPAMAAAYAELGDFDQAIQWQQKAIEKASADKKPSQLAAMELYKAKKPLRLEPKSKK
jgi:tetratricopeptide (TPR) repeat protein